MSERDFHLLITITGAVFVSMALIYVYAGFLGVIVVATLLDAALTWVESQRELRSGVRSFPRD